jgi:EAL and modified HD-GYP domain-containing signal transduction protein
MASAHNKFMLWLDAGTIPVFPSTSMHKPQDSLVNPMTMTKDMLLLGRRPILDRDQSVVAYELLFKSGTTNNAEIADDIPAISTVINHAFTELGIEAALGPYGGFITMNESLLMSDVVEILPASKIVIEIPQTVQISEQLIARCTELKQMGFTLALDDLTHDAPEARALIDLVDIVKIDLVTVAHSTLEALVAQVKEWPVQVLAEKVDSVEVLNLCMSLGFDLFQGYFFAKPHIIPGKQLSQSRPILLKLLGQVTTDADIDDIVATLQQYPSLSINLLRLTNSVACGIQHKVTSLASAITILGRRQLQKWILILLYSENPSNSNTSNPLLQLAARRGKLMEILSSAKRDKAFEETAFMIGILSLMDVLLGLPMDEILTSISVSTEVGDALTKRDGTLGKLLTMVENLERCSMENIDTCLSLCAYISPHDISLAQAESLQWVNAITA